MPPVPHMEKTNQILHVGFVRVYIDTIDIDRSQHIFQFIEPPSARAAELVSEFPGGGIYEDNLSGVGICTLD